MDTDFGLDSLSTRSHLALALNFTLTLAITLALALTLKMPSVHHSLFAQFSATAAPNIPEVVVAADADDDNASTAPSNASSTASLFAGGTREIDVLLRSAKATIDADMALWYEKRRVYGFANQDDIERTKKEEEIS